MEGANLVFVVMLIVIPICLFAGIARTLIAGSHSPGRPWDADQPGRDPAAAEHRSGNI